jgi:hypothetical protein
MHVFYGVARFATIFFVCAAFVAEYVVLYLKINTYSLVQPFQKISAERTVRKGPYNLQQHLPLPAYCPMVPCFIIKHLLLACNRQYISYFTYNCHLTFIIYTCLCLLVLNSHYTKKVVLIQTKKSSTNICGRNRIYYFFFTCQS